MMNELGLDRSTRCGPSSSDSLNYMRINPDPIADQRFPLIFSAIAFARMKGTGVVEHA